MVTDGLVKYIPYCSLTTVFDIKKKKIELFIIALCIPTVPSIEY